MDIAVIEFAAEWGPIIVPLFPTAVLFILFMTLVSAVCVWFFPTPTEGELTLASIAREITSFYSSAPRGLWGILSFLITLVLFKINGFMVEVMYWKPSITTPMEISCFLLSALILAVEGNIRRTFDAASRAQLIAHRFDGLDDYIEQLKNINPPPEISEQDSSVIPQYVDIKHVKKRIITTYRFNRGDCRYVFEHEQVGGQTVRFIAAEFQLSERNLYECKNSYDWCTQSSLIFTSLVLGL